MYLSYGVDSLPLIVLEGIDKAGKNTQAKLLAENLRRQGKTVNRISFPDYTTPLGREIKRFLMGKVEFRPEIRQLLYVANRWEKGVDISRWLREGNYVIADRYSQANLVYGMANGLDLKWMLALEEGLPKANLVLVLDISPEVAVKRERGKDVYEKDIEFQRRIRSLYLELGRRLGWRIIDGEREAKDVAKDVFRLVEETLRLD